MVNLLWAEPSVISAGVSTTISVFGFKDPHSDVMCEFIDVVTMAARADNGTLLCQVFSNHTTKAFLVLRTLKQPQLPVSEIHVVPRPTVSHSHPSSGQHIYQQISVYGQQFHKSKQLKCLVGTDLFSATYVSENKIICHLDDGHKSITGHSRIYVSNDNGLT